MARNKAKLGRADQTCPKNGWEKIVNDRIHLTELLVKVSYYHTVIDKR